MDTYYTDQMNEQSEKVLQGFSWNAFIKRTFDIFMAVIGLVILSPFFLIVIVLLKREGSGPIYYRGRRTGRGGKEFDILKFRTMYERPESYRGSRVTAEGDDRITPLGQWLRDTKLNELPQLLNVLIGEMSLVGPRPEDPEIVSLWPADASKEILSMRPGITSPASVAYHDEEHLLKSSDVMADYLQNIQPDKLRLDRLYVRHHTFLTDLDAIFWTFIILIPKMGNAKLSEGWLFGGPFTRLLRSYLSWFLIDFVVAMVCAIGLGFVWRVDHVLDIGFFRAVTLAVMVAFLFGFFNTVLGVKTVSWERAAPEDILFLLISAMLVILINTAAHLMLQIKVLPLDFVLVVVFMSLIICVVARYRFRLVTGLATRWINLRSSGYGTGERVIIVGAGEGGSFAAWILRRNDFQKLYSVVGIVDDDPAKQGRRYDGFKVMGTTADLPGLVEKYDAGVIFYAISKISSDDHDRILSICRSTERKIIFISSVIKSLQGHLGGGSDYCQSTCPFSIQNRSAIPEKNSEKTGASDL